MKLELRTDDGLCPAHVFHPEGAGPWPGVLLYMDGVGMRPTLVAMAERLAAGGYYVLMPDLFYRAGAYQPIDPKKLIGDPEARADWQKRMIQACSPALVMRDTAAFLAHFAAQPNVLQPRIGATGYCMGGRMAFCAAAHYPDRFAAAAAFHPGGMVSDAPDSPHLLAPQIKARLFIAAAQDDATFTDEQKGRFEEALRAGGVEHRLETWPARHGWVPPDMPTHDPAQAERHWQALFELLERALLR